MFDLRARALPVINLLALSFLAARIYMAFVQTDYLFIDDYTYIIAALKMSSFFKCPLIAANACNYEHPPLAKLFMGLGLEIFGKTQEIGPYVGVGINQLGGRFFQMVESSISGPILYLIVNKITGNWKMAFASALFILVDPLFFTMSLTAGLDIPMVFFGLLSIVPYVYGLRLWRFNGSMLTGFILGLSLLSKETGIFIALAIATFVLIAGAGGLRTRLTSVAEIVIGMAVIFVVGLQLFDSLFTNFPSFIAQLELMIAFHSSVGPNQVSYLSGGGCDLYRGLCPTNFSLVPHFLYSNLPFGILPNGCVSCWAATNPLDWLTFFPPVLFPTALTLVVNYPLVWMSFVWLPLGMVRITRKQWDGETSVLILAGSLFLWNLGSNLSIYTILGRTVFEYYFLPAIPAIAIGGAYLVTRPSVPKWLAYSLIVVVVAVGVFLSPLGFHLLLSGSKACPVGC